MIATESKDRKKLLAYIDAYWDKIILKPKKIRLHNKIVSRVIMRTPYRRNHHMIEVPYTCLVPNDKKFTYIFYWDSYFMFRGLLDTNREWVIPDMVANFVYLFNKYHIIPNLTHPYSLGRSQPPFLTSMIFDAYAVLGRDHRVRTQLKALVKTKYLWLEKQIEVAKTEYKDVWQNAEQYHHFVPEYQLNRYGDRDVGYAHTSELESGWDMTSRFYTRCNEFLPIDLNCYLYKYESDFAKGAAILGNTYEKNYWNDIATERKERINSLMWDEKEGFFYDYDYVHNTRSTFHSLAGFVPLWSGLATYEQAARMVKKLPLFETAYGLTITDKGSLLPKPNFTDIPKPFRIALEDMAHPKQWDYPHIWSPVEYMAVIGLIRYGFLDEAKRIMEKAIKANIDIFTEYGALLEKIDATTGGAAKNFHYPNQFGFGWTNATIYRYSELLKALQTPQTLYAKQDHQLPPYTIAVPH